MRLAVTSQRLAYQCHTRELLEQLLADVELEPLAPSNPTDAFRTSDGRVFIAFLLHWSKSTRKGERMNCQHGDPPLIGRWTSPSTPKTE